MLLLSPSFLDQSFPRNMEELRRVSIALGELDQILRKDEAFLVNIDIFSLFVEEVYWERADLQPKLIDIVTVLSETSQALSLWIFGRNKPRSFFSSMIKS
jgi:hypothetical protein